MAEVETTRDGAVLTIALNRPDKLNAFGAAMHEDFKGALKEAADSEVRAVVLTGAGRGFCVGQDLAELQEGERDVGALLRARWNRHVLGLRGLEKPVVAAVNGAAAGAGMNLALGCDIRIASTAARFSQAFVKRGLHPDWGGTYFLPRVVGMARAAEMIFTGEVIDAAEALRLGIVSRVVAPEELLPTVHALARKIAAGPPIAIRLAKHSLYANAERDLKASLEGETFAQNICFETEDAREGIRAFVDKRDPVFRGR